MPDSDDPLIAQLRDLGRRVDVPAPADQRAAVRARLADHRPAAWPAWLRRLRPAGARRRLARWLAGGAAALVCAVLAVPPARAAVVDAVGGLLRVAGVQVAPEEFPRPLPTRPSPLPASRSAQWDEARRLAKFTVRSPASLGPPEQVTIADPDADGAPRVVTLTYRGGAVRLDEFDGQLGMAFWKASLDARYVDVGGQSAIWLPRPHPVTYVDRAGVERTQADRLAGPALVWSAGGVSYRLEGLATLDEARATALSVR